MKKHRITENKVIALLFGVDIKKMFNFRFDVFINVKPSERNSHSLSLSRLVVHQCRWTSLTFFFLLWWLLGGLGEFSLWFFWWNNVYSLSPPPQCKLERCCTQHTRPFRWEIWNLQLICFQWFLDKSLHLQTDTLLLPCDWMRRGRERDEMKNEPFSRLMNWMNGEKFVNIAVWRRLDEFYHFITREEKLLHSTPTQCDISFTSLKTSMCLTLTVSECIEREENWSHMTISRDISITSLQKETLSISHARSSTKINLQKKISLSVSHYSSSSDDVALSYSNEKSFICL